MTEPEPQESPVEPPKHRRLLPSGFAAIRDMAVLSDGPTYKAWLKQQLKNAVIQAETEARRETQRAELEALRTEVSADLGTAT